MSSLVRLTTTGMKDAVSVYKFEFGTVPAQAGSFKLLADSVPAGATNQGVFSFSHDVEIPEQQAVRFDIRFELNVHNSASLQLRLSPGLPLAEVQWRWAAPIGYFGTWSSEEQQAPWWDKGMDYCININPNGTNIDVTLSASPGTEQQGCTFIPPQSAASLMVRGS